jgi:dTDP-4-dehydrorhamnose 3,5-epimerase
VGLVDTLSDPKSTPISGVYVACSKPIGDTRGQFARLFCREVLGKAHQDRPIVQINRSITARPGAVRGLHFQCPPFAEAKWVRCLHGRVFDVAVDLRRGSPTFLKYFSVELSGARMNALFIPEGCAHGFQVLEPDSELLYLHSAPYNAAHEAGIRWDDPRTAIPWPLAVTDISARDLNHPFLTSDFEGLDT